MLQEDAACILLGVDPDTVVSDDGAGMETVERLKILELHSIHLPLLTFALL